MPHCEEHSIKNMSFLPLAPIFLRQPTSNPVIQLWWKCAPLKIIKFLPKFLLHLSGKFAIPARVLVRAVSKQQPRAQLASPNELGGWVLHTQGRRENPYIVSHQRYNKFEYTPRSKRTHSETVLNKRRHSSTNAPLAPNYSRQWPQGRKALQLLYIFAACGTTHSTVKA